MTNRNAVVLAAGKGSRMKSELYKVLHPVCGKPMVQHVVDQLNHLGLNQIVTIVGHGAESVQEQLGDQTQYAVQEEQLGTGHAVQMASSVLEGQKGTTVVVCGDTPLLTADTMRELMDQHEQQQAKVTVLTTDVDDATGYGRIIRQVNGQVEKIVEEKDASDEEKAVTEINTGTYCFDNELLFEALSQVSNDNAQGEYYLPDVLEIANERGETVAAHKTTHVEETVGVNDRVALSKAEKLMKKRVNEYHMRQGVTIVDPDQTYIGPDVSIGTDVTLEPGVHIHGNTQIGSHSVIGAHTTINHATIGEETLIKQSVVTNSQIGSRVQIGPFAHIRPESTLSDDVKVGNFVEVKKTTMGSNSKASHLSYLGDAELGNNVNVGCGSITVNYDGQSKHQTVIGDDAFIGCNSNLVAPVSIEKGAYVAAGSTITKDVPEKALSIARSRQENKEGYVDRLKKRS
ncbi:bifunctional UDP-N-acetylglucosamine diphosphorylase/glucosamine-1-phosphate N-acetyltransferase GlmU [Alkalibacillus almallahensis]|uniref:bifunctional UDP-N-acetylglucosamine diphosphorylase/glucosamine-1-phosphate N-acetyltransferase GlmU n=1 Tax=Alkalibacillus almallahensis TaxID=1379154 RepID=UPI00141E2BEC|nr:bifunctional UDP-N-acetylglucosamine diphosphorylase/glucosamine-1-phosphate N-acetyltransferase GlmU [Alkalibacillus almallahensis]NIK12709.1 bifunctional UDP-N-acetylglucosamine pyrophosphorylase/glucosamine-1-phosphate N-acetyltransferase [Alkalibacillus almallahensis]